MTAKHDGRWDDEKLPVTTKQDKLSAPEEKEEPDEDSSFSGRRWRWALLALVFFVALGGGFLGAGYLHDKSQEAKNDRIQQELIFARQEESLRKQEAAIRDQREALEREKRALEARQRELEAQAERAAGRSHYNLIKLLRLSIDTIVCFSNLPLKLGVYAGLGTGLLGVLLIIYTLFTRQGAPSGYATIVIVLCFMFAVLFLLLGIIGEYLAIMFREIKDRPVYIIENIYDETKLLTKSSNHDTIEN